MRVGNQRHVPAPLVICIGVNHFVHIAFGFCESRQVVIFKINKIERVVEFPI